MNKKHWTRFLLSLPLQVLFIFPWWMAISYWCYPVVFLFGCIAMSFWQEIHAVSLAYKKHQQLERWGNVVVIIDGKEICGIKPIDIPHRTSHHVFKGENISLAAAIFCAPMVSQVTTLEESEAAYINLMNRNIETDKAFSKQRRKHYHCHGSE